MTGRNRRSLPATRLAAALVLAAALPASAQTIAITNGKVYPVAGPVIERGTVVIRDGRIAAVGVNVPVPAGARIIDATGKVVTPGFMDAATGLGVVEVEAVRQTNDQSEDNKRITAAFNMADAVDPFSTLIPIERVEGITRAAVAPGFGTGQLIKGQGIVIDLGTEGLPGMVDRSPAAMYVDLGSAGARVAGGSRAAAILLLRQALDDARDYAANRRAFDANARRAFALSRLDLEALQPVVRGELPLAIQANRAADILEALRFAREEKVKLILTGAEDGWVVADQIARAGVPVVIDPQANLPDFEARGTTLQNAARLARAGVPVAFATFDEHNARNVKYFAGNAVAYGMPYDAALRAVTAEPARIFGIADHYGTLEPGKDADVVVWSGDPFELTTLVEHVFIKGREMPADTRQRELLQRYRTLDGTAPEYKHP